MSATQAAALHAITAIIEATWDTPARSATCALAEIALDQLGHISDDQAADLDRAAEWLAHAGMPAPIR